MRKKPFWLRFVTDTTDLGGGAPEGPHNEQEPPGEQQTPPKDDEPFDEARAKAKIAKVNAEARSLRERLRKAEEAEKRLAEIEESQKSEQQKQAEALTRLQQENEALKQQALRAQVAAAKGVPAELLTGGTLEELEARADQLLAFKGQAPTPTPTDFGGGQRGDDDPVDALTRQLAEAQKAGNVALSVHLKRQLAQLRNPQK